MYPDVFAADLSFVGFHASALPECMSLALSTGGPLDKSGSDAQPSCRGGRGCSREADPGGGRSGRGPEPPEGGGDVQHRRGEVEEEELPTRSPDGYIHHHERYGSPY